MLGDLHLAHLGNGRGLQRWLYEALRDAILAGRIVPGSRLPPTRALAEDLGISRQTIVLVYDRLVIEGYAHGRVGAGTYVSPALPSGQPGTAVPSESERADVAPPAALPVSKWAKRALAAPREAWSPERPAIDLRPGVPDWEAFPHTRWRRLLTRRWRGAGNARSSGSAGKPGDRDVPATALDQYGDPAGYRPLREALAAYLSRSRGLRCAAEQVIIVGGSQQALDLLARVCLDSDDLGAMEDPGYPPTRAILRAAGARIQHMPVDAGGIVVDALPSSGPAPKLLYVTPSHQYPTGATLSLPRRLELLEWAARSGALIVEDDYDSELRYGGPPLPALQGLDERGCVAYVGSCSSVLFPPLRVGWIIAPPPLVPPLIAAKWLADRQTSTLDQQVLADFIAAGDFARHLRRSRALYGARRAALAKAVTRHLGQACELGGSPAGLQAPLYLPPGTDEGAVVREAAARGVGVYPIGPCYGDDTVSGGSLALVRRPGLLLGFAAVPEPAIDEGIRRLADALVSGRPTTALRQAQDERVRDGQSQ
ncbi:MAG: PLP-dependent aminotransferase family protein [Chloroflexi bacterium]|nr:PLP-dependent aminotransferase family protein [Chloroflexota bacterium]